MKINTFFKREPRRKVPERPDEQQNLQPQRRTCAADDQHPHPTAAPPVSYHRERVPDRCSVRSEEATWQAVFLVGFGGYPVFLSAIIYMYKELKKKEKVSEYTIHKIERTYVILRQIKDFPILSSSNIFFSKHSLF